MKVIRDIALQLDYDEGVGRDKIYTRDFAFRCRFIGNYLRRRLTRSNFEPIGFKRLLISACIGDIYPNRIVESFLCVAIPFDKVRYDSLGKEELPDFFIEMYKQGIVKASETHELPVDFLFNELEQFKNDGYKNEWEFKSKTDKETGIKATLSCRLDIDAFTLFLTLRKNKKEVVFHKEIFSTFPDELIYHYKFQGLVFEGNKLVVTGWYTNPPLFELDLSSNAT